MCFLVVYSKVTDFFLSCFEFITLLKLLITFGKFLVGFLETILYSIVYSANGDDLSCSFPMCILLNSFLFLQLGLHTLYWKRVWIQDIPVLLWMLIGLFHMFFLQEYFVGGFVISSFCYVETYFLQYYSQWDIHHMKVY